MIDPLVLKAFSRKLTEKTASLNKHAGLGALALLGAGGVGAMGLMAGAGAAGNVRRDMQYGRAERLEEKSRKIKAMMAARNMPLYQNHGGMH